MEYQTDNEYLASIKVAIHAERYSETVIAFYPLTEFTDDFIKSHEAGNIDGVYRDKDGRIVADDCEGNKLKNIL